MRKNSSVVNQADKVHSDSCDLGTIKRGSYESLPVEEVA